MKKILSMYFIMFCAFMLAACGKSEKHTIEILVPAGSTAEFVYSDTEICPTGNKITISSGAGLGDTEVILKPVEVKQKTAYEPAYLTHGMPVKMDVEKGGWFKIGVSVQNDSDRGPIAVSVDVEGVEVRIAEKNDVIFNATVLEVHDGYYLVNPVEGSLELNSADKIEVVMKNMDSSLEVEVGDIIEITYDGMIMELYPAKLHEVYDIKVVEEDVVGGDLIPMVMVNGELFFDTGTESGLKERCGMIDGEITSEVSRGEKPIKDEQSNFGTGYGYQYGSKEGTIEININGKWWIFATEEARKQV